MSNRVHSPARARAVALAIVVGAVILSGCGRDEADAAEAVPPVTVGGENMTIVRLDTIETGPSVSGTLKSEREAQVRAEVGGSVLRVLVEAGERVRPGQVLAIIDDGGVRDQVLSARSAVASAGSAAETARREVERTAALLQAGAIADRDAEGAARANDAAQAQLASARAGLASAQKLLNATQVKAPFGGVVGVRQVSAGDVVAPGALLLTVVDPSSMRFEGAIPAEQLAAARVGAPVRFRVTGYPDRTFEGRIARVSPVADPVTRQIRVIVAVENTGNRLIGGLFAEGHVATARELGVLVPFAAVDERGVAPSVFRIRGGTVEAVPVQLGIRDVRSEQVQIVNGVSAGDTVLTGAARAITPGTPVVIRPGATRAVAPTAPLAQR